MTLWTSSSSDGRPEYTLRTTLAVVEAAIAAEQSHLDVGELPMSMWWSLPVQWTLTTAASWNPEQIDCHDVPRLRHVIPG